MHPWNLGLLTVGQPRFVPSTPAACFYLLDAWTRSEGLHPRTAYRGKTLVIVGRSTSVGEPPRCSGWRATRPSCCATAGPRTPGLLAEQTRTADILIVAAGEPGLIHGDMVREGVVEIDVGTNAVQDLDSGQVFIAGDLDLPSVSAKAAAVTPGARRGGPGHRRMADRQRPRGSGDERAGGISGSGRSSPAASSATGDPSWLRSSSSTVPATGAGRGTWSPRSSARADTMSWRRTSPVDETADLGTYTDVVVGAIGARSELVVVGHSFGAFTASLVSDRTRRAPRFRRGDNSVTGRTPRRLVVRDELRPGASRTGPR